MAESIKARLVSILRGRRQPASSKDEVELARAAFDARKPSDRAEKRPTRSHRAERR